MGLLQHHQQNHLTKGNVDALLAFYSTPTGQKMLQQLPVLMQESVVVGQRFGQSLAVELESRMKDELRKKGYKDL